MPSYVHHARQSLTELAATGADARRIADRAVSMWRDVDAALAPIIGRRGVAALFKRSVLMAVPALAPLLTTHEDVDSRVGFDALRGALGQQSSEGAIETNDALLQKFADLLIGLIGESLTERLLHSASVNPSSDDPAQEFLS